MEKGRKYNQEGYKSIKFFQSRLTIVHFMDYLEEGKGMRKDLGCFKESGFIRIQEPVDKN